MEAIDSHSSIVSTGTAAGSPNATTTDTQLKLAGARYTRLTNKSPSASPVRRRAQQKPLMPSSAAFTSEDSLPYGVRAVPPDLYETWAALTKPEDVPEGRTSMDGSLAAHLTGIRNKEMVNACLEKVHGKLAHTAAASVPSPPRTRAYSPEVLLSGVPDPPSRPPPEEERLAAVPDDLPTKLQGVPGFLLGHLADIRKEEGAVAAVGGGGGSVGAGRPTRPLRPGDVVQRNPGHWRWGTQDGGPGGVGEVLRVGDASVWVRWASSCLESCYRHGGGADGSLCDVLLSAAPLPRSPAGVRAGPVFSVSSPRRETAEAGAAAATAAVARTGKAAKVRLDCGCHQLVVAPHTAEAAAVTLSAEEESKRQVMSQVAKVMAGGTSS